MDYAIVTKTGVLVREEPVEGITEAITLITAAIGNPSGPWVYVSGQTFLIIPMHAHGKVQRDSLRDAAIGAIRVADGDCDNLVVEAVDLDTVYADSADTTVQF